MMDQPSPGREAVRHSAHEVVHRHHGASDDGGRDEFHESSPRRRFNCAIPSACPATTHCSSATRAVNCSTSRCGCSHVGSSGTPRL